MKHDTPDKIDKEPHNVQETFYHIFPTHSKGEY